MRIFSLFFLLTTLLIADLSKQEIYNLFQNKHYKQACEEGYKRFDKVREDDTFITMFSFACLYSDNINKLAIPITILRDTKQARQNAAFFSIILMQKKLLYHAMIDGYDISNYKLPTTDYILSTVFDLYIQALNNKQKLERHGNSILLVDPVDKTKSYRLYVIDENAVPKVAIDELVNDQYKQQHLYW